MRYFTLVIALFLSGCMTKGIVETIFLREDKGRLYNIENGDDCLESGYEIVDNDDKSYTMIVFYSNCAIHRERHLQPFEIKQWRPNAEIKSK